MAARCPRPPMAHESAMRGGVTPQVPDHAAGRAGQVMP